jgi:hypothetical protein
LPAEVVEQGVDPGGLVETGTTTATVRTGSAPCGGDRFTAQRPQHLGVSRRMALRTKPPGTGALIAIRES